MADSLFADRAQRDLARRRPLAARLRPRSLDGIVGQDHLVGPSAPLRLLIESDRVSSLVLWGPAGTGKTTIAEVIAATTAKAFVARSAVSATVKDVRAELAAAERRLGEGGQGTILFLDEVHRFNKAQQDALLPAVESGLIVLVGATTENPYFEVNRPLLSRSALFRLHPLDDEALRTLLRRGLEATGATADGDAAEHLVARAGGDGRAALGALEVAVALAGERGEPPEVRLGDAEAAVDAAALGYGVDEHYDVASAFIKSIRGSDPDAGLYWLARMLEAGEDPRFVARRLVILASEDVGMAEPAGRAGGRRRRPGRGVRRAARGRAEPGARGRVPGHGPQVEPGDRGAGPGPRRRARPSRRGAAPPARRPLRRGAGAGPRRGLRVPARRFPRLESSAAPTRRRRRQRLLRAVAPRRRAGDPRPLAAHPPAAAGRGARRPRAMIVVAAVPPCTNSPRVGRTVKRHRSPIEHRRSTC